MKNVFTFLILIALSIINCFAQSQFQITIGGTNYDYAYSIVQTSDGGYAIVGSTQSWGAGSSDMYIIKLSSTGSLIWSKTVGGISYDEAYSIVQTTDGGYAVSGRIYSFGADNYDMFIVKLSSNGSFLWSKTVGVTDGDDVAYSIVQTNDGGYAMAGWTSFGTENSDFYIVKLDATGSLMWSKTVGGLYGEQAISIIQTSDGGYAIAGLTRSLGVGSSDMYIIKLSSTGSLMWSKTVGGTGDDVAQSIVQTTDGGYAVAGVTSSFGAGGDDMYIVKLSSTGSLLWSKTMGGTGDDIAASIIQTTDGGFAITGVTNSFGAGTRDMYIIKLSSIGSLLWSKTVGGTSNEYAYSIVQTQDGGYAVAGRTNSFGAGNYDIFIVKLDANGNTCVNSTSPISILGTGGTLTSPTSTITAPSSTVTAPSPTVSSGGSVTTICFLGIKSISNEIPKSFYISQNYPNPFNPLTKIKFDIPKSSFTKLIVYDILGREVTTLVNEQLKPGSYEVEWNASRYSSGIYFYTLTTESFNQTKRMVLIK